MEFQITQDDVINVLNSYGVTGFDLEDIMSMIDDDAISQAALCATVDSDDTATLDNQTQAAYDEIAKELFDAGIISAEQIKQYGNTTILA